MNLLQEEKPEASEPITMWVMQMLANQRRVSRPRQIGMGNEATSQRRKCRQAGTSTSQTVGLITIVDNQGRNTNDVDARNTSNANLSSTVSKTATYIGDDVMASQSEKKAI